MYKSLSIKRNIPNLFLNIFLKHDNDSFNRLSVIFLLSPLSTIGFCNLLTYTSFDNYVNR